MENASKALMMAGGVLIAVMVISFIVFILRKGGAMSAEYDTHMSDQELARFNGQFEIYDKDDNTIFDVITVANLAYDINKKANWDEQAGVKVVLTIPTGSSYAGSYYMLTTKKNNNVLSRSCFWKSEELNNNSVQNMYENGFIAENSEQDGTDKYIYKFECTNMGYNSITGKVDNVEFKRK